MIYYKGIERLFQAIIQDYWKIRGENKTPQIVHKTVHLYKIKEYVTFLLRK